MGTKTILSDDLDGSEAAGTSTFLGPDGLRYEIDLNEAHAKQLHEIVDAYTEDIGDFLAKARPVAVKAPRGVGAKRAVKAVSAGPRRNRGSDVDRNVAIRDWAKSQGIDVNERGRLSKAVVEAYDAVAVPAAKRGRG
jgi:hypothetical protein